MQRVFVRSVGSYLPEKILTNDDMSKFVETSHDWVVERTGIHQRHIAADGQFTSDLGTEAAKIALDRAGWTADSLDLIVLATTTPDRTFPATATTIQAKLGMGAGVAFDMQAVCSGFVFGLSTAEALMQANGFKRALVIGAETLSRLLDWTDRTTCVLFGDGAGCVTLELGEGAADEGLIAHHIETDGRLNDLLWTTGGPSLTQTTGTIAMVGNKVYRHAVNNISASIETVLEKTGLTGEDIDLFIPHQANKRILDAVAKRVGIPEDKVVITIEKHANTSAASIPLALDVAFQSGRVKPGQRILVEAMGGGLSWGASLFRF